MKYQIIPVTPFQQNCTLIWCENTRKAAVVDPGGDLQRIYDAMEQQGVVLDKILLTHGHIDHVGAAERLATETGIAIEGPHEADAFWLEKLPEQSQRFGFAPCNAFVPTRYLYEGDHIHLGDSHLEVLHCPGHTPGHIVFFDPQGQLALVGDVLFRGSIGRTDFPGSDHGMLIHSIRTKLWPLGDEVAFIPGHGPMSTFAAERSQNPFVADQLFV